MHTQDGTYTTYSRKDINPLCECGKESQDTVHLYKCVDEIYGNTKSMDAKGNHDINSILNYFNLPPIAGMMAERKEEYRRVYDAKEAERGHARARVIIKMCRCHKARHVMNMLYTGGEHP
jgi:hypothetical protein